MIKYMGVMLSVELRRHSSRLACLYPHILLEEGQGVGVEEWEADPRHCWILDLLAQLRPL